MRFIFPVLIVLSLFLSGCQLIPKWPEWASFSKKDGVTNTSGTVAEAKSGAQAVDRMAEIQRREAETRKILEEKYAKFRQELQTAYDLRTKVDNENFDAISDINYGIFAATENLVGTDNHILVANLKSQENMARLMPISEKRKDEIKAEIEAQVKLKPDEIQKVYDPRIAAGVAKAAEYDKADAAVKAKEAEKSKIRTEADKLLAQAKAERDAEVARMKREADDAVAIAKEKQRQEMLGWIVKGLLGVGILILIAGLLMKAATLIVSGIFCLGLAYAAAMVPIWVIPTVMGISTLAMVFLDHKTGKPHFVKKKAAPAPDVTTPPAP